MLFKKIKDDTDEYRLLTRKGCIIYIVYTQYTD